MNNPILAFSARRRMRSVRTPLLLTLYALLMSVLACVVYWPIAGAAMRPSAMTGGVTGYAMMVAVQFVLIVLVAPAMTAGSLSGERERQTLDLLLVTDTGTGSIVLGKLLESFGFLALMALCSLPAMSLVLLTGGSTLVQVLTSMLFLLLLALEAECIGLYCSALFKRTVTATVVSYLAVFGIGLLTLLPIFYDVKRIGDIYDSLNIAGQPPVVEIPYVPIAFTLNPGLGLFSLLCEQLDMFRGNLWSVSYTLANTLDLVRYDLYLIYNMVCMGAVSALLTGLSALHMRRLARRKA